VRLLAQNERQVMPLSVQVAVFGALKTGRLDDLEADQMPAFEQTLLDLAPDYAYLDPQVRMDDIAAIAAHRHTIEHLIPLLNAIRSVAEIAWRRAEQGLDPLTRYSEQAQTVLETVVMSLEVDTRTAMTAGWSDESTALLLVASEHGLCGPLNDRVVAGGLKLARELTNQGKAANFICLGSRGQRLIAARGKTSIYSRTLPSFSVPTYVDIEEVALDMLDLLEMLTLDYNLAR
jgi:hypothetical protein